MILSNTIVIKCFIGLLRTHRYTDWLMIMIPKIVLSKLVGKKRFSQLGVSFSIARPTDFCSQGNGVAILGEIKRKNLGTLPTVTCFDGRIHSSQG